MIITSGVVAIDAIEGKCSSMPFLSKPLGALQVNVACKAAESLLPMG